MHLTHQTPSALLLAFGLVCYIADGEFIRFEKEKNKPGVYHEKLPQNYQSQLKSVSLESQDNSF